MTARTIKQEANPPGVKPVGKLLAEFAVPGIMAMLVSALYNIVDQFFIGHYVGMRPIVANMYTSIGKAAAGAFMSLTRQILFLMPLLVILPGFFGLEGAMYAAPVADFAAFIIAAGMLIRETRRLQKEIR